MKNKRNTSPSDALEAALHEAALHEAETRASSPGELRIAAKVSARVRDTIAALRRQRVAYMPTKKAPTRPALDVFDRVSLLAQLDAITARLGGAVAFSHRDLSGLEEHDLRELIAVLEDIEPAAAK